MAVKRAEEDRPFVAVVPITHSPHSDPETAIEIPRPVAAHLALDSDRCWVVLEDVNVFTWPGYDLRPISGQPALLLLEVLMRGGMSPFLTVLQKNPRWQRWLAATSKQRIVRVNRMLVGISVP